MRRVLTWIRDYWYIPLAVLAAIAGALLLRKRKGVPLAAVVAERVAGELKVIAAGAEVRRMEAELGAEQAKRHVADKYHAEKAKLDEAQAAEAKSLEDDPVALAKFLVKAAK